MRECGLGSDPPDGAGVTECGLMSDPPDGGRCYRMWAVV